MIRGIGNLTQRGGPEFALRGAFQAFGVNSG